jgi:hypothetical protein
MKEREGKFIVGGSRLLWEYYSIPSRHAGKQTVARPALKATATTAGSVFLARWSAPDRCCG